MYLQRLEIAFALNHDTHFVVLELVGHQALADRQNQVARDRVEESCL
jgi:hypothetical protein